LVDWLLTTELYRSDFFVFLGAALYLPWCWCCAWSKVNPSMMRSCFS